MSKPPPTPPPSCLLSVSSFLLWFCPVFPPPTPALLRGWFTAWTLADVSVAAGHTDRSGLGSVLRDLVKPGDENLREMNKKLQNMLEEQLTKNMHLHKASVDHQPAHPSLQPLAHTVPGSVLPTGPCPPPQLPPSSPLPPFCVHLFYPPINFPG